MFQIGKLTLKNNLFLAPMARVTNASYRLLCKNYGCGLGYSALMDEDGVVRAFSRFNDFINEERPIGGQIVGRDPETMSNAARIIEPYVNLVDINFGCPDKDVLAKKAGAYHIKHPENIHKIVSNIKDAVRIPVTAKIRIGWDLKSLNYLKIAKIIEDAGADAIAVHARTKEQGYSGKADWNAIKEIKENAGIPVIGNGDANSPEEVKKMIDITCCDAVMIGRGAIGNPWIFKQSEDFLKSGSYKRISDKEKIECFFEFFKIYKKHQNISKFSQIRMYALWFTKGVKASKEIRKKILKTKDERELTRLLEEFAKRL